MTRQPKAPVCPDCDGALDADGECPFCRDLDAVTQGTLRREDLAAAIAESNAGREVMGDGGIATADTTPTDRRAGDDIPPTHVACPFCAREGTTEYEINRCHGCGRWFAVDTAEVTG